MTSARNQAALAWYSELVERPDSWCAGKTLAARNPGIFVDTDGRIAARFHDARWFNPATGKTWHWHAEGKTGCRLYPDAKSVMFHILFHPDFCDRSPSTQRAYYYWLRLLCRECEKAGFPSISLFFSDDRAARLILNQLEGKQGYITFVRFAATLIGMLFRIDEQLLGFKVVKGPTYAKLCSSVARLNKESFQHPPIPWNQYSALVSGLADKIQGYLQLLDKNDWVEVIRYHHETGRHYRGGGRRRTGQFVAENLPNLAGVARNFREVRNTLSHMIDISRIAVMTFTGCRIGEMRSFAPRPAEDHGNGVFLIYGRTTKTGKRQTYWVTNWVGANAIRLALKVRKALSVGLGHKSAGKTLPLFPSFKDYPAHLFEKRSNHFTSRKQFSSGIDKILCDASINIPPLDEIGFQFLLDLSIDSKVNLGQFKVGKPIRITSHQFRRSLIYFGMRSGDIEIGAFKLQFKHWHIAMTEYYSSGVEGLEGATNETMSKLVEHEYFTEIDERLRRHIAGFDRLGGGVGATIRKNLSSAKEARLPHIIERTREQMLRRARQGEIRYHRTPLGACTSTAPCLSRAQSSLSACLGCRSAVLQADKVRSVYDALRASAHPFMSAQAEHFSHFLLAHED